MAEKREEETPELPSLISDEKSDYVKDPVESLTTKEKPVREEELETNRESKRRKKCPVALEKLEESEPLIRASSFSFDTKIPGVGPPESTPKFGSFNLMGDLGLLVSKSIETSPPKEEEVLSDPISTSLGFGEEDNKEGEKKKKKTDIEGSTSVVVKTC